MSQVALFTERLRFIGGLTLSDQVLHGLKPNQGLSIAVLPFAPPSAPTSDVERVLVSWPSYEIFVVRTQRVRSHETDAETIILIAKERDASALRAALGKPANQVHLKVRW